MTKAGGANSLMLVLDQVAPSLSEFDRDNFFESPTDISPRPVVWELYPEVVDVLEKLESGFQLAVLSNFDGRLRFILGHLGISKYFAHVFISSELERTNPIRRFSVAQSNLSILSQTKSCTSVTIRTRLESSRGRPGLSVFKLDRQRNSLRGLLKFL